MAAFSLVTYLRQKSVFTETEVRDYLAKAISLAGIAVDPRDVLHDLISAFCMLLKDGTLYAFTHRSFQEYFAALHLIHAREDHQRTICDHFIARAHWDQTLDLAHGMNPDLIEMLVIVPFLEDVRLKTKYRGTISRAGLFRFLSLSFSHIWAVNNVTMDISYVYSNQPGTWRHQALTAFVRRRFDIRRKPSTAANEAKIERAERRLFSCVEKQSDQQMKISALERNPQLAKDLFDVSYSFKQTFEAMMKLLDDLKSRHKEQVSSFNDLLKG